MEDSNLLGTYFCNHIEWACMWERDRGKYWAISNSSWKSVSTREKNSKGKLKCTTLKLSFVELKFK